MRVQRCKGTRDLSPEQMMAFRLVEKVFRQCCLRWGYQEVRTPTLEYLHLFTSTGTLTPSRLGKVYSFLDWDGWSGERVVLRPDGTIPVARYYIDCMEGQQLAKLFYVANVFSFEETGEKTRETWQCGVELIGVGSPLADVELITLALEVLKILGVTGVELRLSHAGLIRALLARLGLSPEEQTRIFDQVMDGDAEALRQVESERPELKKALPQLLCLKGKSSGFLKNLRTLFSQNLPELKPGFNDFIQTADLLQALGVDYQIDLASGKGFEYYTGVISQFFAGGEKIGGGGRYDALIPLMGGRDVPASGFALYLDPLMDLVDSATWAEPPERQILIRTEPGVIKEGFGIASSLREAGYVAQFHLGGQEPANLRWTLDVRAKAPLFILTDQVEHRKFKAQTAAEVLALLDH